VKNAGVENVAPECTDEKLYINYIILPEKHVDVIGFKPDWSQFGINAGLHVLWSVGALFLWGPENAERG